MAVVYKLDRSDGLSYIGITTNFKKRLTQHKNSKRFKELLISDHSILFEGEYAECQSVERIYIEQFDTYNNGLNVTPTGQGRSETCKFNTLGFKYSDASRKKMSEKAKARIRKLGYRHSEELKAHWSKTRKGKIFTTVKISPSALLDDWYTFCPTVEQISSIPTRMNKRGILVFVNSRPYSFNAVKLVLFAAEYCTKYGVTPNAIKRVIKNAKQI